MKPNAHVELPSGAAFALPQEVSSDVLLADWISSTISVMILSNRFADRERSEYCVPSFSAASLALNKEITSFFAQRFLVVRGDTTQCCVLNTQPSAAASTTGTFAAAGKSRIATCSAKSFSETAPSRMSPASQISGNFGDLKIHRIMCLSPPPDPMAEVGLFCHRTLVYNSGAFAVYGTPPMKKLYIGLDTHKEKIVIGLAFAGNKAPEIYGRLSADLDRFVVALRSLPKCIKMTA